MTRPKIKTALTAALGLIGLSLLIFAGVAVSSLRALNHNTTEIASTWLPKVDLSKEMANVYLLIRIGYRDTLLASDAQGTDAAKTLISTQTANFSKAIFSYEALGVMDSEKAPLANVKDKLATWLSIGAKLQAAAAVDDLVTAKKILTQELRPVGNEISKTISELVTINLTGAQAAKVQSGETYSSAIMYTIIMIAVALVVVLASIWFALAGIAKPIEKITSSMKKLASGDSASAIPYEGRADEIGEMAAAVEVFRANAVNTLRLEQEADAQRNLTDEDRRRKAEADRLRAEEMVQATAGLGEGLKNLARGDLTRLIHGFVKQDGLADMLSNWGLLPAVRFAHSQRADDRCMLGFGC